MMGLLGLPSTASIVSSDALPVPVAVGNGTWVHSSLDATQPYPICLMKWGAHEELDIIDLAILSSYSYANYSQGNVNNYTSDLFNNDKTTTEVVYHQPQSLVGRVTATRFRQRGSPNGTIVLAVKGSSESFDFYADFKLWGTIATFQALVPFLNLLDLLPNSIFANLLGDLGWIAGGGDPFKNVEDTYSKLVKNSTYANDTFILTGHSLGGGIAIAAGGHLSKPSPHPVYAVAFSGPGSHFSRYRFGTSYEMASRSAVDVKPMYDFIHKFDRHDDMGQYIQCQAASPVQCHCIRNTICELWRVCGYRRPQRDFKMMCHNVFSNNTVPPLDEFLTNVGHFGEM